MPPRPSLAPSASAGLTLATSPIYARGTRAGRRCRAPGNARGSPLGDRRVWFGSIASFGHVGDGSARPPTADLPPWAVDLAVPGMIQAPKVEPRFVRYELSDCEWGVIKPMLPNKPRDVPRVNDRRLLNGTFWVLRSGAPWRDLPETYGPGTTCYNRFVRWRRAGVWDRIMEALTADDRYVCRARAPTWGLHRGKQRAAHGPFARRTDQQVARRC